MKNKPESAKSSSKSAAASQPKTQAVSPAPRRRSSDAIGITLYDLGTDQTIADFDLTPAEFAKIQEAVAERAKVPIGARTLTYFIREALLKSANRELFPGSPMMELESAVDQANGLLRLALEHQAFTAAEAGDGGREMAAELVALLHSTTRRLKDAFLAAHSYADGRAA